MRRGLLGLVRYLWDGRRMVLPGLLFLVLSDALQLVVPMVTGRVVDQLMLRQATSTWLMQMCLLLVALTVLIILARMGWRRLLLAAARMAEVDLRRRLMRQVLSLPVSHFTKTHTGEVMALATSDVPAVRMALAFGVVAGFDATIFALVAVIAMALLDWRLALWTVLPFPLLGVIMIIALRLIYERWDAVQEAFEELTEKVRESVAGMRVLRAYVQDQGDLRHFDTFNRRVYERQMSFVRVDSLFHPAVLALAGMSTAILLGVGGTQVIRGETTLGTFTAFSAYLAMLTWPMIAVGWVLTIVQRGAASMNRISEMLEETPEATDGASGLTFRGGIEARQLTFRYSDTDPPVLDGVSFRIEPGGSLGLVGEIGSGKSTVAQLLCRIYDPPPNTLFIDGRDITTIARSEVRQAISLVPQEAFLFSESIEENLRMGHPDATSDAVMSACRLSAVHDEVMEFPEGYATLLGERGVTLSGGQKQRVALARALLKAAPIIILDDTLSAVDAEAERRILHELRTSLSGRTAVVISHRISAVRDLDRILVLQRGRVLQEGTHAELVAQGGLYRELYELQELEA